MVAHSVNLLTIIQFYIYKQGHFMTYKLNLNKAVSKNKID